MTPVGTMETHGRPACEILPVAHRVKTDDGVELALARYVAEVTHRVPVLLTHGTLSNGTLRPRLAAYLAQQGFDCWVMDLGLLGRSQGGNR